MQVESPFMAAVFTAVTFCLIVPYLASIFNSHSSDPLRQPHMSRQRKKTKKQKNLLSSSPPPFSLHTSIESSLRVFTWEKEEAVFGFGS